MINVGINRGHNSSVALLEDGDIVFHIENERLSRIKYDEFPFNALFKIKDFTDYIDNFCIAGLCEVRRDVEPFANGHDIYSNFILQLNKSFNERVFTLNDLGLHHHKMHASCAFYNSGFEEALCIVKDGAGSEYYFDNGNFCGKEITSVFSCKYPAEFEVIEKQIYSPLPRMEWDHASTEKIKINDTIGPALAFEITSITFGFTDHDAGKIMGMAAYGKEDSSLPPIYKDGKINKELFLFRTHSETEPPRSTLNLNKSLEFQDKANFAFALQKETQENVKKYIHDVIDKTECKNICLSGGFFLNCVANYEYLDGLPEDVNVYIEPNSSDAGTSLGAAKYIWHSKTGDTTIRKQNTLYYGPEPDYNVNVRREAAGYEDVISLILEGNPVALYQGRSESGPRALGNRSIIYDPRDKEGKDVVNTIKNREWFRPFAGTVLHEKADEWFDMRGLKESPFMMYAMNVRKEKINEIPAITHVDETCRVQTLKQSQNLHFYNLIKLFYEKTGVPILFNTSFNLAGDPLVETIDDALYTLRNSNLNYLYLPEKKWLIKL